MTEPCRDSLDKLVEDKTYENLSEVHNMCCAAFHALKCMEGMLETVVVERDGYTFEDMTGNLYTVRRALQMLDTMTRVNGLKTDPIPHY